MAFNSVEHIMRDVSNGWIIRYTHANVASFFFICVYLHIARGLYYGSFKSPRVLVWSIGVIILVLMIAIGFLGYFASLKWMYFTDINMCVLSSSILPFGCSSRLQTILDKHNIKPVFVFEDLVNTLTKPLVSRSLKSFAGIYMVVNLSNRKFYIGSAVTGNLYSRFHKHLFSLVGSKVVASAVSKYGLAEFAFLVLEIVPKNILAVCSSS